MLLFRLRISQYSNLIDGFSFKSLGRIHGYPIVAAMGTRVNYVWTFNLDAVTLEQVCQNWSDFGAMVGGITKNWANFDIRLSRQGRALGPTMIKMMRSRGHTT